jgi:prophage DNA circulation protein
MIKTFEQFINENYNEKTTISFGEEYGAPLFNEISESLMSSINNSINEGNLVIDYNMIEEGLFDSIGNLFKKGANAAGERSAQAKEDIEITQDWMKELIEDPEDFSKEVVLQAKVLKSDIRVKEVTEKIESLCKSAEEICTKLAEKEAETYKTISEKMTAANDAIKKFTEDSIAKINEIVTASKNKLSDVVATVLTFCQRMVKFAKDALTKIGQGIVFGLALPIMFAYSVYKGAVKVCEMLVEKVKDGAKIVKNVFTGIKNTIATWVSETLTKAKELLKSACDAVKDGAKKAYNAIGKTYLAIVATLGQLASDVKDKITETYNKFVDGVKDFSDEVKAYVSEKWDTVSKWCKKTSTAFAEGVKNVWEKTKEKVMGVVGSVKDAYKTLEDDAEATWDEIVTWNEDRVQNNIKAKMKYAADKWGKDTVSSWLDEM